MQKKWLGLGMAALAIACTGCFGFELPSENCSPTDETCIQACYNKYCGENLSITSDRLALACMADHWSTCIDSTNKACRPTDDVCVHACYVELCGPSWEDDKDCVTLVEEECIDWLWEEHHLGSNTNNTNDDDDDICWSCGGGGGGGWDDDDD